MTGRRNAPATDAFLFDTSAFITLTDYEPGGRVERVRELLTAAKRGDVTLFACLVSLTEVQYIKTYGDGMDKARHIMNAIRKFPILWIHSDAALCAAAAELKAARTISFADAFVAATALRAGAVLLHKDPQFKPFATRITQEMLPLQTSAATAS